MIRGLVVAAGAFVLADTTGDLQGEALKYGLVGLLLVWVLWRDNERQKRQDQRDQEREEQSDRRWEQTNTRMFDLMVKLSGALEKTAESSAMLAGELRSRPCLYEERRKAVRREDDRGGKT
jgi:hypothetical protein